MIWRRSDHQKSMAARLNGLIRCRRTLIPHTHTRPRPADKRLETVAACARSSIVTPRTSSVVIGTAAHANANSAF